MNAKQEESIALGPAEDSVFFAATEAPPAVTPAPVRGQTTDTYAVAVRVLRIAPAWLLVTSVAFVTLTLLLGWVKPGADASGEAYLSPNDSKVAATVPPASPSPSMPAAKQEKPNGAAAQPAGGVAQAPSAAVANTEAKASVEPTPLPQPSTAPAPQQTQTNVAGDAGQKFTVQVGSHSDESSANEQTSRLRSAGFDARTVVAELPGRGKWFRVQAGSFDDRAEAAKQAAAMRSKGVASDAIVVPQQ